METFAPGSVELTRHATYLDGRAALETDLDLSRGDPSLRSEPGCTTSGFLKEFRELAWRYRNVVSTVEEYAVTGYGGIPLPDMWLRLAASKDIAANYAIGLLETGTVKPVHRIFEFLERLTLGVPHHSMDNTVDFHLRIYATINNPILYSYSAVQRADLAMREILEIEDMHQ
jgi:hypothetical protein